MSASRKKNHCCGEANTLVRHPVVYEFCREKVTLRTAKPKIPERTHRQSSAKRASCRGKHGADFNPINT